MGVQEHRWGIIINSISVITYRDTVYNLKSLGVYMMDDYTSDTEDENSNATAGVLTSKIEYELDLLKRHVKMLKLISEHKPIGIIKLSNLSKHPQHKVRYSLRMLEQEGLIIPSPDGAVPTDKVQDYLPVIKDTLASMKKVIDEIEEILE
jgi:predicted transcriptional regulator